MTTELEQRYEARMAEADRYYQEPFMVEDFITQEQVQQFIDLYNKLPVIDGGSHHRATRKDNLMYHKSIKFTQDLFMPKLQALWPDKKIIVDGGNFTEWHEPVGLHTDGYQQKYSTINDLTHILNPMESILESGKLPGYTILVPLKTDTGEGTPYTLTFDQRVHGANRNIGDAGDVNKIINYTNKPFDKTHPDYPKIDFHSDDILYGYSIQTAHPWKPGRAIVFSRGQFHSAAKFQSFNSKLHLLFFTSFQE